MHTDSAWISVREAFTHRDPQLRPAAPSVRLETEHDYATIVIGVLGLAFVLLVVFEGIAVLQHKDTSQFNTMLSTIAGGFVGGHDRDRRTGLDRISELGVRRFRVRAAG